MKMRTYSFLLAGALVALGSASCRDSLPTGGPDDNLTTDVTVDPTDVGDGGFFVDGSNDVAGGGGVPPAAPEETTEGEETRSHFRVIQIDPVLETSAGPKFVMDFDIDNDGLVDLITGWNQSQPVQIHLQRRDADGNISFATATLGGTGPIASIGDLDMADFNGDGWLDAAVLVKETGSVGVCPTPDGEDMFETLDDAGMGEIQILFSPGNADDILDGDAWTELRMSRSQLPGRRDQAESEADTYPEFNSYSGMAVGDFDGINGPDVIVAYNPASCAFYGDDPNPINRIVLYANPGGDNTAEPGDIPYSVTADAGDDQETDLGATVTLNATGSFAGQGIRGLGPGVTNDGLSFNWQQIAGTNVALSSTSDAEPEFIAPNTDEVLTFRLAVTAGGRIDFDYVNIIVGGPANLPPTVTTDRNVTAIPDADNPGSASVTLSAFGTDPNGAALTYAWQQVAGTAVALTNANSASPSFAVPADGGELRFRVTVNDGALSDSALVIVSAGVWAPVVLHGDLPVVSDVKLSYVDPDDDPDVVFTYPDALTANISWLRNPVDVDGAAGVLDPSNWETRPVGHVDTQANVIALGDVDGDGFEDVLARSTAGLLVEWFRHPGAGDREPIFPPPDVVPDRFNFPWQVYAMDEYEIGKPAGLAIGDLNNDGLNEVAVAAGGVVYWYDGNVVPSRYDQWGAQFVVDDTKTQGTTDDPNDPNFQDTGTVIYGLTIVDIDGDGVNDVIATFDRRVISGQTDDRLLWFRNTLFDDETADVN